MAFFKIRMLSADPVEVPEVMKFRTGKSAVRRDKAQIGKEACGRFIYVSRVGDASERLHKRKGVVKGNGSGVDQQVFYRIMKMAEKSMLEEIEAVQRERKEYREYIEKDPVAACVKVTRSLSSKRTSFITLIYGEGITQEQAEEAKRRLEDKLHSDVEITLVAGGQPVYYFIVSVE